MLLPYDDGSWHVVQVKRHTGPLDSKQQAAIVQSLARLGSEEVLDLEVSRWSLAMPWDPTRKRLAWLHDLRASGSDLVLDWMGRATLDALAANNPQLVDYYFGDGAERLQTLMARALDAGQPLLGSGPDARLSSATARIETLAEVMDEIDPFYRYEIAPRELYRRHVGISRWACHSQGSDPQPYWWDFMRGA